MNRLQARHFLAALAACSIALTAGFASAQSAPRVDQAWARPTVEGQAGGGAFLRITGGSAADRLVSVQAGVARAVELHTMDMQGNVMRMRQVDGIDVPAGQVVELKPGGNHVMFVGLTQSLKAGSSFPLTLKFQKAGEVRVDVKVMTQPPAAAASTSMHGGHGDHGG